MSNKSIVPDFKKYGDMNASCPKVDINTRIGWLTAKRHFGQLSTDENRELEKKGIERND